MTNQLAEAIRKRRLISISYLPGQRLVEPHAVGISKDGNALLRAYQVSGASASGDASLLTPYDKWVAEILAESKFYRSDHGKIDGYGRVWRPQKR